MSRTDRGRYANGGRDRFSVHAQVFYLSGVVVPRAVL